MRKIRAGVATQYTINAKASITSRLIIRRIRSNHPIATTAQIAAKPWIIPAIHSGYAGKKPEAKVRLLSEKISHLIFGANFPNLLFGFGLYQFFANSHSG